MPFYYRESDNSDELPKIAELIARNGGSIVAYRQIYSFIFGVVSRDVYEHLPQGRSSFIAGLKHAALSLLFGPWSWLGPFVTLQALMVDLSGGIDITHVTGSRPDGVSLDLESLESSAQQKEKALQYGFATILFVVLGVLVWKLVIPEFDSTVWSPGLLITLLVVGVLAIVINVAFSKFRR